jgi:hypothetical protein
MAPILGRPGTGSSRDNEAESPRWIRTSRLPVEVRGACAIERGALAAEVCQLVRSKAAPNALGRVLKQPVTPIARKASTCSGSLSP